MVVKAVMDSPDLVEQCIDAFWSADVAWTTLQSRQRMSRVVLAIADYLTANGHDDAAALLEFHTSFKSRSSDSLPRSSQS